MQVLVEGKKKTNKKNPIIKWHLEKEISLPAQAHIRSNISALRLLVITSTILIVVYQT